jgi:hypothetical protein
MNGYERDRHNVTNVTKVQCHQSATLKFQPYSQLTKVEHVT